MRKVGLIASFFLYVTSTLCFMVAAPDTPTALCVLAGSCFVLAVILAVWATA